jgi:hypothetical protein
MAIKFISFATLLISTVPLATAGSIGTLGAWNGSSSINSWGSPSSGATPSYGETFTATDATNLLNSMTFEIQDTTGPIAYQAYVFDWSGTGVITPALFTSPAETVNSQAGFQQITIDTGALVLTSGNAYIALFSTIGETPSANSTSWGGSLPDSTYTGGTFQYNNSTDLASLSSNWNEFGNFGNLAFSLDLGSTAAPEPSSLVMLGSGLFLAWGARKRITKRPTI